MRFPKPRHVLAACLLTLVPAAVHGQSDEEFVLKSGRRIPAASVKPAAGGFTATIVTGASAQKVDFKAADIEQATLREPAALAEARTSIANEKLLGAVAALTAAETELEPYRGVPGGWWHRARILRMDATAARGQAKEAAALADPKEIAGVADSSAAMLKDFRTIVSPAEVSPDAKVTSLEAMAKRSTDPWFAARALLEVGTTQSNHGKVEDAVKSWIRVAIFHPAERDLAARATILAARGLQQLERPQDGVKLLDDYLADNLASPYAPTIETEISKLDPKRKTDSSPASDPSPAGEGTPEENSN